MKKALLLTLATVFAFTGTAKGPGRQGPVDGLRGDGRKEG